MDLNNKKVAESKYVLRKKTSNMMLPSSKVVESAGTPDVPLSNQISMNPENASNEIKMVTEERKSPKF
jgi:hypothetical protein